MTRSLRNLFLLLLATTLALSGCATGRLHADTKARATQLRQSELAVHQALALAEAARRGKRFDQAAAAYRRALEIAPDNPRARAGLDALGRDQRHHATLEEAEALLEKGEPAAALARARAVLAEDSAQREALALVRRIELQHARAARESPQLAKALQRPVTLQFRDASLRSVLEVISRQSGLNFVFDRDVPAELRTTVFVKDTPIDEAIRMILLTSQLERRVLNEKTILIYPATPAKTREYRELVMKSFYLTNADAKETANMIRALVKTRDVYVDETLNLVVMRDTPEAVRVAERLVANQDLSEAEVVLEVEVLEVGTSLLQDLGVQWPSRLAAGLQGAAGVPGQVTLPEWLNRDSSLVQLTFSDPLFVLNLRKEDAELATLANPRIRVKDREKARIHIGDKVPVVTTTTTATGFVAESVTYLETGLKLEVEPRVHLDSEVGIKIGLEVSSISSTFRNPQTGTVTYEVGTRNAATTLRLQDGETQVLAGLISDEERRSAIKVPGLGDLPVLGRLFSSTSEDASQTEIVLLITPRVVRNVQRPEARLEEFVAGTEAAIGGGGGEAAAASAPQALPAKPGAATARAPSAPAMTNISLAVPEQVPAGQEFAVQVLLEGPAALRAGKMRLAFDPERLSFVRAEAGAALGEASLNWNAEPPGQLDLTFEAQTPLEGAGSVARLVFRAAPQARGNLELRLESASLTDTAGKVVPTQGGGAAAKLAVAR